MIPHTRRRGFREWIARAYERISRDEWAGLLASLDLEVSCEPLARGAPFADVLFVARRRPVAAEPIAQIR